MAADISETFRKRLEAGLRQFISAVTAVVGCVCFVFGLYWYASTGHSYLNMSGPSQVFNLIMAALKWVSALNVLLAVCVLISLDGRRGLIGLVGSGFALLLVLTAGYRVS